MGADQADMQLISKYNRWIYFFLYVIVIYCTYAWVVPLKDKKCITISHAFQKVFNKSKHRLNKMWVDKGSKCYKVSMKTRLQDSNIVMYSTYDEANLLLLKDLLGYLLE